MGGTSGSSFVLEDTTGNHPKHLQDMANIIMAAASENPKLAQVFMTFTANVPKVYVEVDRKKALDMGVSLDSINNTLKVYIGQAYVNDFNKYGKVYRVWVQGKQSARSEKEDIQSIYVRSSKDKMVPMTSLVDISTKLGPPYLKRHNMRSSLVLICYGMPGISSGEVMTEMEKIAEKTLPNGMTFDWTDMSYQEKAAGSRVVIILVLSLLFIYLFLVAQYESWMIPGGVMLAIPIAFLGAVVSLWGMGMTSDIYSQVGMVLLFGVSAKTSILIIEFAKSEHESGKTIIEAAAEAAKLRFRAVLMTAISFICGTLPLVFASGAGAASRQALGVTVVGGMTLSCILGTLLVPGLYFIIQKIIDRTKRKN
jgi:HAE1 family hydrophobic/amphiphilic exporter-1